MIKEFIILDEKDNVATALVDLAQGFNIADNLIKVTITCIEDIPKGHKVAITFINEGEDVIKYGSSIGRLTQDVQPGELVHVRNLISKRGKERNRD